MGVLITVSCKLYLQSLLWYYVDENDTSHGMAVKRSVFPQVIHNFICFITIAVKWVSGETVSDMKYTNFSLNYSILKMRTHLHSLILAECL